MRHLIHFHWREEGRAGRLTRGGFTGGRPGPAGGPPRPSLTCTGRSRRRGPSRGTGRTRSRTAWRNAGAWRPPRGPRPGAACWGTRRALVASTAWRAVSAGQQLFRARAVRAARPAPLAQTTRRGQGSRLLCMLHGGQRHSPSPPAPQNGLSRPLPLALSRGRAQRP